ncbi:hypothetical protein QPI79_002231 [Enterococcus faecalis]|uniref:hypothetical protein n=1 Tax=Enterococcus faecium TaxID=1352 RepID=UPI001F198410|nr:hypothetical protein [Enterococcus faecium]EKZ0201732.1 hypothetical protein [Enterococcus faecalis]MCF8636749.1 hypothetical protein [Enterococcus faecium]
MFNVLLRAFVIVSGFIFLQIAYSAVCYRKVGKVKWIKFVAWLGLISGITYFIYTNLIYVERLPIVKQVIGFFNSAVRLFLSYISAEIFIVYFMIPLLLVWIYYLSKTVITVVKKKLAYNRWVKSEEDKLLADVKEIIVDPENEISNEENEFAILEYDFLDVPLSKIRYKTIFGLQRAYELAKEKGLQIGQTDTGYVAIYAEKEGIRKLKEILSMNSVDYGDLENRPSIVFFSGGSVTNAVPIMEQLMKIKEGESVE